MTVVQAPFMSAPSAHAERHLGCAPLEDAGSYRCATRGSPRSRTHQATVATNITTTNVMTVGRRTAPSVSRCRPNGRRRRIRCEGLRRRAAAGDQPRAAAGGVVHRSFSGGGSQPRSSEDLADLAFAVVAGRAGVQRDRRGGRLLRIDQRGFLVVARQRRQLREELARQLVDEILGEIAAADEQPLRRRASRSAGSAPRAGWPRP